jgi:hypothetical protein
MLECAECDHDAQRCSTVLGTVAVSGGSMQGVILDKSSGDPELVQSYNVGRATISRLG